MIGAGTSGASAAGGGGGAITTGGSGGSGVGMVGAGGGPLVGMVCAEWCAALGKLPCYPASADKCMQVCAPEETCPAFFLLVKCIESHPPMCASTMPPPQYPGCMDEFLAAAPCLPGN